MAIWETQINANNKIASLWDNSVTTSNKIAKVWDFNGTEKFLVYGTESNPIIIDTTNKSPDEDWTWDNIGWDVRTITRTADGVRFYQYANTGLGFLRYNTKVDLTSFNKLYVKVTKFKGRYFTYGVSTTSNLGDANYPEKTTWTKKRNNITGTGTFYLDVSSLTGNHYIKLELQGEDLDNEVTISDMYFE